ncbi:MAG: tRNA pseudouridine(38-40) synthase TruA [Bacteroidetes bacterium]|nr:tRNA pseudouridine(38-40) synthase TruA [Bacteroidota bacterium]
MYFCLLRYRLNLCYRGTAYNGWQRQINAIGVQQVIEEKIEILFQNKVALTGCGRTDTGVHAKHFVAHFDSEKPLPDNFVFRLNGLLPRDIAVFDSAQTADSFHARFDAKSREYKYYIHFKKNPFLEGISWFRYGVLDFGMMNRAADMLIGQKEFICFCKGEAPNNNYVCDVTFAQWEFDENGAVFTIRANRFLRNMVRAIVGSLIEVGNGKLSVTEFEGILQNGTRSDAGESVPAKGLVLEEVVY